jgi:hypothetical protein
MAFCFSTGTTAKKACGTGGAYPCSEAGNRWRTFFLSTVKSLKSLPTPS